MNRNSNLSPLPFYKTIEEQSFRLSYANGMYFPLIAPKNRFLPFQIVRDGEIEDLNDVTVTLCNFDGTVTKDISLAMQEAGLRVKYYEDENYTVISFPGIVDKDIWTQFGLDFNNDFTLADFGGAYTSGEGRAYLKVEHQNNVWYSEVMTLVSDLSGTLKMEWYSYKDIVYRGGRIAYEGVVFSNIMYIRSEIGRPTYDFSDDGEDRNGYYFATKQISEKTYHFTFLATEPVCDAIRIASLSDVVLITDQYGRQYLCDTFLPTPSWQGTGYLASIDCEFQCDTMVVQPSRMLDSSSLKPQFFIDGSIKASWSVPSSGADSVVVVLPNLPGLHLQASKSWVTVTHLYDNAYRVVVGTSSSTRTATLKATSDFAEASITLTQGASSATVENVDSSTTIG